MTTGGGECSQAWEKTAEPHNETTSWDRKRARVRRIYTTTSNYAAHGIITLCVLLYQKKKGKVKLCRRQKSVGSEGAANPINHTTKTMRRKNREENSKNCCKTRKNGGEKFETSGKKSCPNTSNTSQSKTCCPVQCNKKNQREDL